MKHARGFLKLCLLIGGTLFLYSLWMLGRLFVGSRNSWRRFIYSTWARFFKGLLRVRITVVGIVPQPPYFLVANHMGYADIPVLRSVLEGVFVAKHEISQWPVVGRIISDMGNIFINRQSRADIPRAGEEILAALDIGEGVIVFPEGTSSEGAEILQFNSSFLEFAARRELPIHYATISYSIPGEAESPRKLVAWADTTPLREHVSRLFELGGFDATVTFGEAPLSHSDRKELAKLLHTAITATFVPLK
jgi:1-acyl-sn-glycerol-3-phosphate acyltransferase